MMLVVSLLISGSYDKIAGSAPIARRMQDMPESDSDCMKAQPGLRIWTANPFGCAGRGRLEGRLQEGGEEDEEELRLPVSLLRLRAKKTTCPAGREQPRAGPCGMGERSENPPSPPNGPVIACVPSG